MMRRLGFCAAVMATLMSFPTAASAGGWWSAIDLESEYLLVGRTIQARTTEFLFSSIEDAERARDGSHFYAYLLRGYDFSFLEEAMAKPESPRWWRLGEARTTLIGRVTLSGWHGNLVSATARFVVPDVELGTYALMYCTAGCTEPLGDVVPSRVTLIADPETSRLARHVSRLDERLGRLAESLEAQAAETMNDTHLATMQAADAVAAARELHSTIDNLQADLRRVAGELDGRASTRPWLAIVGWFIGGAATALLVVLVLAKRRRPPTRFDVNELERLMDEESELTSS